MLNPGKVCGVLPPSALLKYLIESVANQSDRPWNATVSELELGTSPVISVLKSQSVLEALNTMTTRNVSVVAVVDDATHAIVGSLSLSDVKLLFHTKSFGTLLHTCWQFIQHARADSIQESSPVYAVREGSSLFDAASKLVATHVHYIYVVDAKMKPVRVISVSDVFAVLVVEMDKEKELELDDQDTREDKTVRRKNDNDNSDDINGSNSNVMDSKDAASSFDNAAGFGN
eukprot:c4605_g1_i1.p1 GENE.c4605_g1_i1~~c4605_g1_i1.p1  ORF type:complete len:230 (-),score=74.31 c4605_g1_i1:119-808(-)